MTFTWREHSEAHEELRAAVHWYENKRDGWGDRLVDAVETAIKSILDPSISWGFYRLRRRTPQIYTRSVAGFPLDIIFLLADGEIYVVAYAHEKRRPGYWMQRLNER
jgi:hypothetical protein